MITLEKLTQFTHENLRYKSTIKVSHFKVIDDYIELQFQDVMGEVVKLERYYNWLSKKREEKINKIL
jgi:DNA-directed RNA polymerase delta subunit